ncbi:hypothetical protein BGZ98_005348 [Dissophora globulifera]|nr:hypothetical protein BGZ98_005348 [Dissophora globulifera]
MVSNPSWIPLGLAAWMPSFAQLIQIYFTLITTLAVLAATLPPLRDSILSYGKLDHLAPSSSSSKTEGSAAASASSSRLQQERTKAAPTRHGAFFELLRSLKVPKVWFAHFYVFATLWMLYLSLDLILYTSSFSPLSSALPTVLISTHPYWSFLTFLNRLSIMPTHPSSSTALHNDWTPPPHVILLMACYLCQAIRRWYESWYVERPSPTALLHVGHYIVGISFYAAMAPSLWVDWYEARVLAGASAPPQQSHKSVATIVAAVGTKGWIGLVLYLWASWHQHRCHVILANLRKHPSKEHRNDEDGQGQRPVQSEYKVPFGDWFEYLVTPHYSAEMVIYLGFYLMASSSSLPAASPSSSLTPTTMLLALIWVVVNLGIVARESDQWYRSRFGEHYAGVITTSTGQTVWKKRFVLIPFVY